MLLVAEVFEGEAESGEDEMDGIREAEGQRYS